MQQLSWWTQHLAAEAAVVALAEECEEVDMCVKEDADINGVTIRVVEPMANPIPRVI